MPRKRDPRRNEAKTLWLKSMGKLKLKEIAAQLDVLDTQVRKWKSQDKWADELNSNVTKREKERYQSMKGNEYAKGNRGNTHASPPKRNKNAVKTGESESIYLDELAQDEQALFVAVNTDPLLRIDDEIRLLGIRQHRMLKRLHNAENSLTDKEVTELYQLRKKKQSNGEQPYEMKLVEKSIRQTSRIDLIIRIEDAMTRVSNQMARLIKERQAVMDAEVKNELLNKQSRLADMQLLKAKADLGITDDDEEDDGFIEAIDGRMKEVWSDEES